MNTLLKTGTLGLAAMVTTGVVAWQSPAVASHGADDRRSDDRGHHHGKAFKRDDDAAPVVTTVDDDDDDDTGLQGTNTGTRTGAGGSAATSTRTRGGDDSHGGSVRDLTSDGPGRANVDHSRHHTNDGTRHNTRG